MGIHGNRLQRIHRILCVVKEFNNSLSGPYTALTVHTPITYHLSKSALMATQGPGTGVSVGAAVSESDMASVALVCMCELELCSLSAAVHVQVYKGKRENGELHFASGRRSVHSTQGREGGM